MQCDYIIDKKIVPYIILYIYIYIIYYMLYNPSSPELAEWYHFTPGKVY